MGRLYGADTGKTVGFYAEYHAEGELSVGWNSGMINQANYGNRAAPDEFRQAIMDALKDATGLLVQSK